MWTVYNSTGENTIRVDFLSKGVWINVIDPSQEELAELTRLTGMQADFLAAALDDEELPRVENEDDETLIIVSVPVVERKDVLYDTLPLGIILNENYIVTVCLEDVGLENDFVLNKVKSMATYKKTRFIFQILHKKTGLYLKYLREINRRNEEIESALHQSMRNKELINLMNMEKSLVYFTTSLRYNQKVLDKISRGRTIKMYEEDEDLLEDVIIENRQAIEMADVYSNISTSTMNAFASIISNNLNIVMKLLASITIVLSIPTMIASFFGMNFDLPFRNSGAGFLIVFIICIIACLASIIILRKKDML